MSATSSDAFVIRLREQIGSGNRRFGTVDLHELRVVLDELERLRAIERAARDVADAYTAEFGADPRIRNLREALGAGR